MKHIDVEHIHDEETLKAIIKWQEKQMDDLYRIMEKYRMLCEEAINIARKENEK